MHNMCYIVSTYLLVWRNQIQIGIHNDNDLKAQALHLICFECKNFGRFLTAKQAFLEGEMGDIFSFTCSFKNDMRKLHSTSISAKSAFYSRSTVFSATRGDVQSGSGLHSRDSRGYKSGFVLRLFNALS